MWYTLTTVFGICFIFLMTTLGASVVYFFKKQISSKTNALFLGFASGIMLAASVWSLLIPAIEQAEKTFGAFAFFPAALGFILGGVFLVLLDGFSLGRNTRVKDVKSARLFLAVTLHNIPEGLAVGFAFGAAFALGSAPAYASALGLAIGVGLQNFPEGAAIALPMKNALGSNKKAFLWGAASGAVEPLFATVGFFLAAWLHVLQPWLLAFAAGAMVFVVAQDLLPDARCEEKPRLGAWGALFGFAAMMILDVALG